MKTVLNNATRKMVRTEPFPHILIDNVLPQELAGQLLNEYPSIEVLANGRALHSNQRLSFGTKKVRASEDIPESWKCFIDVHVSQAFLAAVIKLFAPSIRTMYPELEQRLGSFETLRSGIREIDSFDTSDILLDAQICANTPVVGKPSSVRGPHVDLPNKLFAGLFYLRHPDDDSHGGELVIYKWRKECPQFYAKQYAPEHLAEEAGRVPYRNNTLVVFINSPHTLHGVTPREASLFPRLFMNLVGEVSEPLFDFSSFNERMTSKMQRRLSRFIPLFK